MSFIEKLRGQQELFLDSVKYEMSFGEVKNGEARLAINDSLDVCVEEGKIKVVFLRVVNTVPMELFSISVSFGCFLPLKEDYINEKDWDIVQLKEELLQEKNIIGGLVSRSSMLISQISSSYGQSPIITQPIFILKQKN